MHTYTGGPANMIGKNLRWLARLGMVFGAISALMPVAHVNAADERAKKDANGFPAEIAITTGTKEIRGIKANDAGILLFEQSGTGSVSGTVTANQGTAAAASGAWPTKLTDGTDTADVTAANAVKTDGSASTQPISASSLPLPSGAATEASLSNMNLKIATGPAGVKVDASVSTVPVQATDFDIRNLSSGQDSVAAVQSGAWTYTASGGTVAAHPAAGAVFPISDNGGSITVDGTLSVSPGSWTTTVVSTGACGAAATLAIAAQASAKTAMFCNEGTDAVRVGPSSITSSVGTKVLGSSCVPLDGPSSAFQGALYCIRTTGSDQAFNTFQGLP